MRAPFRLLTRTLLGSIFSVKYGMELFVKDIDEVMNYVRKLPSALAEEMTERFAGRRFTRTIREGIMQFSQEEFVDIVEKTFKVSVWMVQAKKDFRGSGIFGSFLEEIVSKGRSLGMDSIQFDMLNVSNSKLWDYFMSWSSKGWKVEIIQVEGAFPYYRLTKELGGL